MPRVSVVLPTHDRAATIGRAVASVLAQRFDDFELIVVDDASTDDTAARVAEIRDPRLRYVRLERNRGAAGARNAGLASARAAWIAFQDSDDEWLPGKLEDQWRAAEQAGGGVGLVLGGYQAVFPEGVLDIRPHHILAGGDPRPDLLDGWPIITPTWLVRAALLKDAGGFDESFGCLEDWDLVLRLSDRCDIRAVPGPILRKHSSTTSICADDARMAAALERILSAHARRWDGFPDRLARRLTHLAYLRFMLGDRSACRALLRRAMTLSPFEPAVHGLLGASLLGGRAMRRAQRLWPRHAGMAP